MKPTNLLFATTIFALGFVIAWNVKPNAGGEGQMTSAPAATRSNRTAANARQAPRRPQSDRYHQKLVAIFASNPSEWNSEAAFKDLTSEDYPELLQIMADRAGFTGLDNKEKKHMEILIQQWFLKDPEGALQWVSQLPKPEDSEKFLSGIIGIAVETDWEDALRIAKDYGVAQGRKLDMPSAMRKKLGQLDAEELVRVASLFVSNSVSRGSSLTYTDDFDFRKAAEGMEALNQSLSKSGLQSEFRPSNLLAEWAKRDFNAAYEWSQRGNERDWAERNREIFDEFERTMAAPDFVNLFIGCLNGSDMPKDQQIRAAWMMLNHRGNSAVVEAYFHQMPGDREENLTLLLKQSMQGSGGSYDNFKQMLLSEMTPEERVRIFQKESVLDRNSETSRVKISTLLRNLGHSEEEIARMVQPKTQ